MNRQDRKQKVLLAMLAMQRWPWEQGVASQALVEIGENDLAILFAKDALVNQYKDGRLAMKSDRYAATDPAANGEAVLFSYHMTKDSRFKDAADRMLDYLLYRAPKTREGILYHNENEGKIFSDANFMAPPFLALAGRPEEAVKQVFGNIKILQDHEKHLLSHIWDDDFKKFERKAFWGVGNGWSTAGIAKLIDFLPDQRSADKQQLAKAAQLILDSCLKYQLDNYLFYDVLDDSSTFVETNLAQMLAFTIYRGMKSGWLDSSYLQIADNMRLAVYNKVDEYGLVQDVCGGPAFDHAGTAVEGQAFFLFMESSYDKYCAAL